MYISLSLFPVAPTRSIKHPWNALFHFSFLILRQSVGLPGRGICPSQGHYLHSNTNTEKAQISMPWVGFEHTISVSERAKSVHTSDRATTVISAYTYGGELLSLTRRLLFTPRKIPGTHLFEDESTLGPWWGWKDKVNWKIHLIGTRTRDLPACRIVPQPTTLPRAPTTQKWP
jgi:hypothetical protein